MYTMRTATVWRCGGYSPANITTNRRALVEKNMFAMGVCTSSVRARGRPGRGFPKVAWLEACEAKTAGRRRVWTYPGELKRLRGVPVSEFRSGLLAAGYRIMARPGPKNVCASYIQQELQEEGHGRHQNTQFKNALVYMHLECPSGAPDALEWPRVVPKHIPG